jgi:hypothetical protein
MSTTNGPFTLTLDQQLPIPNPTLGGVNFAKVQLQNSSGFVLTVIAAGLTYTLQPFIAQTIPLDLDGQPIQVTPTQVPGGDDAGNNTLTAVWLLDGETAPMQDGPLTAAAIAAAISGSVAVTDVLVNGINVGTTNVIAVPASAVLHSYSALVVILTPSNIPLSVITAAANGAQVQPVSAAGHAIILFGNEPGVGFNIVTSVNMAAGTVATVIGISTPVVSQVQQAPGLPLAEYGVGGSLNAQANIANGLFTIVAAPAAGLCYRIHLLSTNGSAGVLLEDGAGPTAIAAVSGFNTIPLNGQLIFGAIQGRGSAATDTIYVTYDLILIPTVQ